MTVTSLGGEVKTWGGPTQIPLSKQWKGLTWPGVPPPLLLVQLPILHNSTGDGKGELFSHYLVFGSCDSEEEGDE